MNYDNSPPDFEEDYQRISDRRNRKNSNSTGWLSSKSGIVTIFIALIGVLNGDRIYDSIDKILMSDKREWEIEKDKRLFEIEQEKWKDSILNIERIRFNEQASRDSERIVDQLRYAQRLLNDENNIAVWSEHNGGDPVATGSFKYISVLYAQNNIEVTDVQRDYHNEPINSWHTYLINKIKENEYIYYPDLSNVEEYTSNSTSSEYGEFIGSKSLIAFKVKSTGKATYFFSVSFDKINPHLNNKYMKLKLENVSNILKDLIYEVPQHLKYKD